MEEIIIEIAADGSGATVKVNGVKGESCIDVTRSLEKAMGATTADNKTSEYYEQPQELQHRNRR